MRAGERALGRRTRSRAFVEPHARRRSCSPPWRRRGPLWSQCPALGAQRRAASRRRRLERADGDASVRRRRAGSVPSRHRGVSVDLHDAGEPPSRRASRARAAASRSSSHPVFSAGSRRLDLGEGDGLTAFRRAGLPAAARAADRDRLLAEGVPIAAPRALDPLGRRSGRRSEPTKDCRACRGRI